MTVGNETMSSHNGNQEFHGDGDGDTQCHGAVPRATDAEKTDRYVLGIMLYVRSFLLLNQGVHS